MMRYRWQSLLLAGAFWCGGCAAPAADVAAETTSRADGTRPTTHRRADRARYVEMRDGVPIAASFYFPRGQEPTERAPTILVQTRYGRAGMIRGFERFVADGYVLAAVDTRGSTSSFGPRRVDIGPEEIADMEQLVAFIARQPWSDGSVFAQGTSYMADTADIATSRPAPALAGAIIREVDFDVYRHLFFPGGVANQWFLENWGGATKAMDEGRSPDPEAHLDCRARAADCAALWPILDPVDGDENFHFLRQALAGRNRWKPSDYADLEFHDDAGRNGYPFFHSSPAYHLAGVRREAKPAQVWGSWMDGGTAAAALARYRSALDVPMEIWITANDHPNVQFADPFLPDERNALPSLERQHEIMTGFYAAVRAGAPPRRRIHYYVLGTHAFRETHAWPPAGVEARHLYLAGGNRLSVERGAAGTDRYAVDFTAGTGERTRWSTQFGTSPAYPDRRFADARLMVFDSEPFDAPVEIAGDPVVDLRVSTATADPAFHVYLEDIAPDGRVTYLTEGMLRAIHRAPADPAGLPFDAGPAPHSFLRADALPVKPDELMRIRFALFPVAARIEAGHRVRLAIAGADADYFRHYSEGQPETFTVHHGGDQSSMVTIPLRPWHE
jgi:hypothetical protein